MSQDTGDALSICHREGMKFLNFSICGACEETKLDSGLSGSGSSFHLKYLNNNNCEDIYIEHVYTLHCNMSLHGLIIRCWKYFILFIFVDLSQWQKCFHDEFFLNYSITSCALPIQWKIVITYVVKKTCTISHTTLLLPCAIFYSQWYSN